MFGQWCKRTLKQAELQLTFLQIIGHYSEYAQVHYEKAGINATSLRHNKSLCSI